MTNVLNDPTFALYTDCLNDPTFELYTKLATSRRKSGGTGTAEGMQVEPDNDCLAALLLSHRAKAFQKQREEAIECEKLLTDAQKEVDEAQAALLAAQRRLIKVPLSPLRSAG